MSSVIVPLLAGVLIGLAAGLLLLLNGRLAGVSGIVAGAVSGRGDERAWRLAFLAGLIVAGLAGRALAPDAVPGFSASLPLLAVAGVLVGFGARYGGGCTSGHGVCGVGRLSPRSLVGTITFVLVAMGVVFIVRHVLEAS